MLFDVGEKVFCPERFSAPVIPKLEEATLLAFPDDQDIVTESPDVIKFGEAEIEQLGGGQQKRYGTTLSLFKH